VTAFGRGILAKVRLPARHFSKTPPNFPAASVKKFESREKALTRTH
jgi:hypothetical protein